MLGELYRPRGLALETAQAVLQVDDPWACNVAAGCSNGCRYCYLAKAMHCSRETALKVRHPKKEPWELVEKQLNKMMQKGLRKPEGVFLSFLTDPFLAENRQATELLIELLQLDWGIPVATSSKLGVSWFAGIRSGMTIVSLDPKFWTIYEPNTLFPRKRLDELQRKGYTWVSMEPYPVSAIWKQNIDDLLDQVADACIDLIVFGKWNYDKRATTFEAKLQYRTAIITLHEFCDRHNIRVHVKSDTLRFAGL